MSRRINLSLLCLSLVAGCPAPRRPDPVEPDLGSPQASPGCPFPEGLAIEARGRRCLFQVRDPNLAARTVRVVLPEAYSDRSRSFPVLYAHDGQDAFEGGLDLARTLDSLVRQGAVPPHLIVALDTTEQRSRELKPLEGSPSLTDYGNLLVMQVKPLVDRAFRTRPGREATAIVGYSLGGLANFYLLMRFPTVFGRVGCMSPSLWWRGGKGLQDFRRYGGPLPLRLWIDAGAEEHGFVTNLRAVRRLALAKKGMTLGRDLGYLEQAGAGHSFGDGARRMHLALSFLLSDR